jgi:hypothetical protein
MNKFFIIIFLALSLWAINKNEDEVKHNPRDPSQGQLEDLYKVAMALKIKLNDTKNTELTELIDKNAICNSMSIKQDSLNSNLQRNFDQLKSNYHKESYEKDCQKILNLISTFKRKNLSTSYSNRQVASAGAIAILSDALAIKELIEIVASNYKKNENSSHVILTKNDLNEIMNRFIEIDLALSRKDEENTKYNEISNKLTECQNDLTLKIEVFQKTKDHIRSEFKLDQDLEIKCPNFEE